jgi:hypothetical protein
MTSPRLALEPGVVDALRAQLAQTAQLTIRSITAEVPEYTRALDGAMGATISSAVQTALAGFLRLAAQPEQADPATPVRGAVEGAYALGRGEARSGRTVDALLAAYRVGARVAWREWSSTAVAHGAAAGTLAEFAELVFAYIDQLSAASVAGHTDELATSGRVREQYLERLGRSLLDGDAVDDLTAAAERADWPVPRTLTAVALPGAHVRAALAALPQGTLALSGDVAGLDETVLLVPDARSRRALLQALRGRSAVVGPSRPWVGVRSSYERVVRSLPLRLSDEPFDTEEHLARLVLTADPEALADLRARALAPLAGLRPGTAERLAETLLSWLLHQGRREDVAAHLVVHPQTVRYRMTQLRELYGDQLTDPDAVLSLVIALGADR